MILCKNILFIENGSIHHVIKMQSFDHQLVHVYQFHSQAYLYCYTMAWSSQNSLHPNEKYSTYRAQVRCHMKRRGYWGEGLPASFKIHFSSSSRYLNSIWAASELVIILFMLVFCLLCCTGSDALY